MTHRQNRRWAKARNGLRRGLRWYRGRYERGDTSVQGVRVPDFPGSVLWDRKSWFLMRWADDRFVRLARTMPTRHSLRRLGGRLTTAHLIALGRRYGVAI